MELHGSNENYMIKSSSSSLNCGVRVIRPGALTWSQKYTNNVIGITTATHQTTITFGPNNTIDATQLLTTAMQRWQKIKIKRKRKRQRHSGNNYSNSSKRAIAAVMKAKNHNQWVDRSLQAEWRKEFREFSDVVRSALLINIEDAMEGLVTGKKYGLIWLEEPRKI